MTAHFALDSSARFRRLCAGDVNRRVRRRRSVLRGPPGRRQPGEVALRRRIRQPRPFPRRRPVQRRGVAAAQLVRERRFRLPRPGGLCADRFVGILRGRCYRLISAVVGVRRTRRHRKGKPPHRPVVSKGIDSGGPGRRIPGYAFIGGYGCRPRIIAAGNSQRIGHIKRRRYLHTHTKPRRFFRRWLEQRNDDARWIDRCCLHIWDNPVVTIDHSIRPFRSRVRRFCGRVCGICRGDCLRRCGIRVVSFPGGVVRGALCVGRRRIGGRCCIVRVLSCCFRQPRGGLRVGGFLRSV